MDGNEASVVRDMRKGGQDRFSACVLAALAESAAKHAKLRAMAFAEGAEGLIIVWACHDDSSNVIAAGEEFD